MPKTLGHYLLDEAVPRAYRPSKAYTKKDLRQNMVRLAKDDPQKYTDTITKIKDLGDQFATSMGISVGLDDIQPLYKERDAILKPALEKIKKIKNYDERRILIGATQDKLLQHAMEHPGTMGAMARSGARGSALQLMRGVVAPAASSDEKDRIQPWLTTHSYAEGLRPSEWWANNREARMAQIKSQVEVIEPGDLSKILVNNTSDQIVSMQDCNTQNGLSMNVNSPHIMDRYLAKTQGTFTRNTLVGPRVLAECQKKKVQSLIVRSPMTCEAHTGLCQYCVGLNTVGKQSKIGDNIGVKASQSIGEPLTQLALNAKHGVRLSGSNPLDISGLEGFRMIMESPASFKNKATLSPRTGTVRAVHTAPQGGFYVTVETDKLHILPGLKPIVKVGDQVHAGDTLSEGVPKPEEVVKYKGLGAGRNYLVGKLHQIYQDNGITSDRRHFEVLAKATLNHVKIEDVNDEDAAEHGLMRGDIVNYNTFRNIASGRAETTPIDKAQGKYLGEALLYHLVGTQITAPMIEELKKAGIKQVKTAIKAPVVSPVLAPATQNPLLNPDWLVRLGHRYLKKSLVEGAQKGQKSNIHGAHPLPGLVFSAEFGEGEAGRY
jgi:DNA-directed RNA polymerase subunit beta'